MLLIILTGLEQERTVNDLKATIAVQQALIVQQQATLTAVNSEP